MWGVFYNMICVADMFLWILWGLGAALPWIGCVCWLCHIWHSSDNWEGFFGRFWLCQTCAGPLHRFCCNFCANPCHSGELAFTLSRMSFPLHFIVYIHILFHSKNCCFSYVCIHMSCFHVYLFHSIVYLCWFYCILFSDKELKWKGAQGPRTSQAPWMRCCLCRGSHFLPWSWRSSKTLHGETVWVRNTQARVIVWFCRLKEIQVVQDVKKTMWSKEDHTSFVCLEIHANDCIVCLFKKFMRWLLPLF